MLSRLYIENIAIIEKADIALTGGLNVLTGETGAGKSIIIDSICAVLGERASRELIRSGAAAAYVSAEFRHIGKVAADGLTALGLEPEDGSFILSRELRADGRGGCKINGRPTSASVLRDAGRLLINIHGQHDTQALLDPSRHMGYIDLLIPEPEVLIDYHDAYKRYAALLSEYENLGREADARARRIDLLSYRINEIEAAELAPGEAAELQKKRKMLQNYERISTSLGEADEYLSGSDDTAGCAGELEQAAEIIGDLRDCLQDAEPLADRIFRLSVELRDAASELHELYYNMEYDPAELEEIEQRLDIIRRIIKKYGGEQEALVFRARAKQELERITHSDSRYDEMEDEVENAQARAERAAAALTRARKQAAGLFCEQVNRQFRYLDLSGVELSANFGETPLSPAGADSAELLISANPGEPPKPIHKIASGGELSRIMLAIKSVLADKDDIDTLVFDEIDAGISGRAAHKVGVKMRETARCRQLLCVTHLAQIAAFGDTHFLIEKSVREGRTYTSLKPLSREERILELARINSGDNITEAALSAAGEMLDITL